MTRDESILLGCAVALAVAVAVGVAWVVIRGARVMWASAEDQPAYRFAIVIGWIAAPWLMAILSVAVTFGGLILKRQAADRARIKAWRRSLGYEE